MKKAAQAKTKPSVNEQAIVTVHDRRLFSFVLIQYVVTLLPSHRFSLYQAMAASMPLRKLQSGS